MIVTEWRMEEAEAERQWRLQELQRIAEEVEEDEEEMEVGPSVPKKRKMVCCSDWNRVKQQTNYKNQTDSGNRWKGDSAPLPPM